MSSPIKNLSSTLAKVCTSLCVTATVLAALPAYAGAWVETGDAGQTQLTAQVTGGHTPLDSIAGELSGPTDADLFLINIINLKNFSAATDGLLDTQLMLFTLDGAPVYMNDDADGFTFGSALPQGSSVGPPSTGAYLLAVTLAGYDPINEVSQLLFEFNGSTTDVRGPASGLKPRFLSGFDGTTFSDGGAYKIALTGTNGVPTPSTWTLVVLACGLCARSRYGRSRSRAPAIAAN